ncbi:MAG TPA: phosphoribosylformylglycinamidine synthase, purS protein [Aquifex aeolicus]|uniref:Phosphoribosylformylglycinamidine synthase subunit PurS n=1 Tax=Aquifex aeolicus TaxID=63363 RepID=A0A9D0YPJ4_AQUAO|nr:phosphoribosylformylglycinamidine synthase subunit PurS [Aquificales bacterium]HIP86408.1 phosphoribosylformylglycinamidine synthase, purS protein [Aquifex sp.]HIP98143.1 phosphoribosylformylglycinamidine synthase, purS protein [Aquifex aeolicus]HIQ26550.1 phosphoribosylformylglycinamidine synthase, purS protein [Aquifex aeolicus]
MLFKVLITPKKGLLDPQGRAVEELLKEKGYEGVKNVRVGKVVLLEAQSEEQVHEIAKKILVNDLIEDYTVERD